MAEAFVRQEFSPSQPPPTATSGPIGWARQHLFSSFSNTILTIVGAFIAYSLLAPLIKFALIDAVWTGSDGSACRVPEAGACWAMVKAKFGQYIYGRYPIDERWRVDLFFIGLLTMIPMLMPAAPFKKANVIFVLVGLPILSYFLLYGGSFGLPEVETSLWGGLLVTLVIAVTGILASLPLGILLALGRRSEMPVVKTISIGFIEFWRGVPLITVLFMSSVMFPLFLPEGVNFDKLLRALVGVALFSAAYMAEVVRGGLQAIPKGQYEGAMALGLGYWQMMNLIVLPQALKHVIPGIVNSFIALFKDTTLVLIIGLFDLLGIIQLSFTDASWSSPVQAHTGYLFAAIIFWIFCFGMSRYSIYMENKLHTGHKR